MKHTILTTLLILFSVGVVFVIVFFEKICLFLGAFFIWLWWKLC